MKGNGAMQRTRGRRAAAAVGLVLGVLLGACAAPPRAPAATARAPTDLTQQVVDAERAFAATMQSRDFDAFQQFVADDATFRSSAAVVLVGKAAVAAAWRKYFDAATPPFSWEPDAVTVHAAGVLAISTGPVRDPSGHVFARYTSIWRREPGGAWRIMTDQGVDACDCASAK